MLYEWHNSLYFESLYQSLVKVYIHILQKYVTKNASICEPVKTVDSDSAMFENIF